MILSLITSRLAGPIATGAAVLFLAFGMSQCAGRVKAEKGERRALAGMRLALDQYDRCKANRIVLQDAIASQNEAVEALKREADAKVAESRKAVSEARKTAEAYRKRATIILTEKPQSADMCVEADRVILESVR